MRTKVFLNISLIVAASASIIGCQTAGPSGSTAMDSRTPSVFTPLTLPTPSTVRLASGAPGPDYWQQRADYQIDVQLNAEDREVHATEHITYTNNSPEPLTYLWMNLEQNLFNDASIGARLTKNPERFGNRNHFEGGFDILSLSSSDGEGLTLEVHNTLGRIELPAPIEGNGGVFEFDIEWSFKIPPYGSDRLGVEDVEQGTIFEIAQWFPAVAKYDDVNGWNTLPYIGQGEFYTDYGDFDVSITAPRDHIVVATGLLQNPYEVLTDEQRARLDEARTSDETVMIVTPEEVGEPSSRPEGEGPLTWQFKAHDVRTFAWSSSDAFIWDASGLPDTLVQSVYPKEGQELWKDATDMLRFSIVHYSEKWFKYPYPIATNVNGTVGGMEYPMIIYCSQRKDEKRLYGVTTHEIGHNWFPMVVNTNERLHAWMDEGFNTFINFYSQKARYPDDKPRRGDAASFARVLTFPGMQPIDTPADQIRRRSLGILEYAKTGVGMVLLREQILGPERFDAAFRTYINDWAFKSPMPADFYRAMNNAAGADLSWFWRGWFNESGALDQAVTKIKQKEDGDVSVTFKNLDRLVMPVIYDVTYEDGSVERRTLPVEAWASTKTWTTTWSPGKEVESIVIDPDKKFPDANRKNNRKER